MGKGAFLLMYVLVPASTCFRSEHIGILLATYTLNLCVFNVAMCDHIFYGDHCSIPASSLSHSSNGIHSSLAAEYQRAFKHEAWKKIKYGFTGNIFHCIGTVTSSDEPSLFLSSPLCAERSFHIPDIAFRRYCFLQVFLI
jgi:hypothetical protein